MALSPHDELNLISPYNNDNDYGYSFSMSATANSNSQDGYGITGGSNDAYDIGADAIAYASDVPPALPNIGHHSNPGLLDNDSSNMVHGGDQYAASDQDQYATGGLVQYISSSQSTDFGNGLASSAATSRPMSVQPSSGFVEEEPSIKTEDDDEFNDHVSKDAAKPKTMLGKKKATRFSGNQSLIVTLRRAYSEADREHLGKFYVLADKVNDFLHTPIQKLRHLSSSATGSPNPRRPDLSIDTQKIRNANRKARITDQMLVQYSPYEKPTDLSTPGLTPSSGYGNEFGTSTPAIESDNEFVVASRGSLLWTPPNTVTADSAVARLLGSRPLNPQGFLQYDAYSTPVNPSATVNLTNYGGTGEHPGDDQLMRAQASLNAARGDTDFNTFYVPAPAEDPFTRY